MLSNPPYPSCNQFVLTLHGHEQMSIDVSEEGKDMINHEQAYFNHGHSDCFNNRMDIMIKKHKI